VRSVDRSESDGKDRPIQSSHARRQLFVQQRGNVTGADGSLQRCSQPRSKRSVRVSMNGSERYNSQPSCVRENYLGDVAVKADVRRVPALRGGHRTVADDGGERGDDRTKGAHALRSVRGSHAN